MAAQLSHPHIVPIHHVDEAGDFVFFVMTFIDGETLGERLRSRGPLRPNDAARMLREIGWALAYAHSRGIVHRDVKPDNILLERESGRALVTDFGIAGAASTPSTADANYVRGTVHYLSPEQASGEPVDARSDLYSLGVVGYYAVTGRLPFDGDTAASVMVAHLSQQATPLAQLAPAVPRRLAHAIERCMAKRPEDRWPSGERLAEALETAVETAREIPAPLRVWLLRSDRDVRIRIFVSLYALAGVIPLAVLNPVMFAVGVVPFAATVLVLPELLRTRKVLKAGFSLDDLRSAVYTHISQRREEYVYEMVSSDAMRTPVLFATSAIAGVTSAAILRVLGTDFLSAAAGPRMLASVAGITLMVVAAIAGVAGIVQAIKHRVVPTLGSVRLKFWNGKWGERLVRLASLGLKRRSVAQPSLPQYTEVALGRATDALFASLPKATRRELGDVPATVQRLEADARALRDALEKLEDVRGADSPALDRERAVATEKLAATVAALENIRLGLLRLQIGSAPVTSVTEAIEAATRIGREIDIVAGANDEARSALKARVP
jgi:serine/threonine-protein kinase